MAEYIVMSLPRSRSFWMSNFLSYRTKECAHDLLVECRSVNEFETKFKSYDGSCETAAMVGWKLLVHRFPKLRIVVIKRPVEQVVQSVRNLGYIIDEQFLIGRDLMLDAVSNLPGTMTVEYDALEDEKTCASIFEFCNRVPHDHEWWSELSRMNLQIDFAQRVQLIQESADALENLNIEVNAAVKKLGAETCLHLN